LTVSPVLPKKRQGRRAKGEKLRLRAFGRMSEVQFEEWVRKKSQLPLAVRGHSFYFKGDNLIVVDGGKFVYEDALELVRLLNSKSPMAQLNASVMIAERNGMLRVVVLGLAGLIVVVALFLALH
jgi:hypothetical protein